MKCRVYLLVLIFSLLMGIISFTPSTVYAGGYINFEDGIDKQVISSNIPGLQFTTTEGFDWIYADVRSGDYNAPYPDCPYGHLDPDFCGYTLNGFIFAWLGPNQGKGRIDFTMGDATFLSVSTSHAETLHMEGYDAGGNLIASDQALSGNVNTAR